MGRVDDIWIILKEVFNGAEPVTVRSAELHFKSGFAFGVKEVKSSLKTKLTDSEYKYLEDLLKESSEVLKKELKKESPLSD